TSAAPCSRGRPRDEPTQGEHQHPPRARADVPQVPRHAVPPGTHRRRRNPLRPRRAPQGPVLRRVGANAGVRTRRAQEVGGRFVTLSPGRATRARRTLEWARRELRDDIASKQAAIAALENKRARELARHESTVSTDHSLALARRRLAAAQERLAELESQP